MTHRTCDLCKNEIVNKRGVSFGGYDLCKNCTILVRRATCQQCMGKGTHRVRDDEATSLQATCGESRTQYKTIKCNNC